MTTTSRIEVTPQDAPCGAQVRGVDLTAPLSADTAAQLRKIWLDHLVIFFPDQPMSVEDLERYAEAFGPNSEDPYIRAIPGHAHVVQVKREADETSPLFADNWHSDWSFLKIPPAATALFGNIIPPVGGDTLFANQYAAWDALPAALRRTVEGRMGIHSARNGYSRQGRYGEKDKGRSMDIIYSDDAMRTQVHPVGRVHPETGRTALFVSPGYTIGIEGLPEDESREVIQQLFAHLGKDEFVYRHRWAPNMLTMWDNRCLVHAATGGFEGHRRLLHRITIGERSLHA